MGSRGGKLSKKIKKNCHRLRETVVTEEDLFALNKTRPKTR